MALDASMADRPLRNPRLSRAVQDYIKDYIIKNHLRQGDLLPPETHLAQSMGISRGSVREAVKALESLGILEVRHGNGLVVRGFSFDAVVDLLAFGFSFAPGRIGEILQIRKSLELGTMAEVIKCITDEDIAEMEAILVRWDERVRENEPTAEEDRAFHHILFAASHNQSLTTLLDTFWTAFAQLPPGTIKTDPHPLETIHDHRRILAAVRAGDVVMARQYSEEHFHPLEVRVAEEAGLARSATQETQDDQETGHSRRPH